MSAEIYAAQVALLVRAIPEIAPETDFALRGGTAINLFVRNLPRLSVDIDLVYLPSRRATPRSMRSTPPLPGSPNGFAGAMARP